MKNQNVKPKARAISSELSSKLDTLNEVSNLQVEYSTKPVQQDKFMLSVFNYDFLVVPRTFLTKPVCEAELLILIDALILCNKRRI